jgi:hypothetical protein
MVGGFRNLNTVVVVMVVHAGPLYRTVYPFDLGQSREVGSIFRFPEMKQNHFTDANFPK